MGIIEELASRIERLEHEVEDLKSMIAAVMTKVFEVEDLEHRMKRLEMWQE